MQKVKLFLLFVFVSVFTFAAEQNKLQMVSYFPVPYVAYNDVTVTQFCDVGLLNQCVMNIGPGNATINSYALDVQQDPDKGTDNRLNSGIMLVKNGRLNLNSSLAGSRIYSSRADLGLLAGTHDIYAAGEVSFSHAANLVAIPAVRSASATSSALLKNLRMYPTRLKNDFPGCSEPVSWKRVQIGSNGGTLKEEAILTCGDGKGVGCQGPRPAETQSCGECGQRTRRVWCGADNVWHTENWSLCSTQKPAGVVDCSSAGYECGGKMYRSVTCNNGTGFWDVSGWDTSACWNKNCNGVDTSCNLGCGGYSCTPTCGSTASNGGERSGSCYTPYGGSGPYECASGCGSYGYSDNCSGTGDYWGACTDKYGAKNETTPCAEGKTGSRTTTCDASCSGAINCTTTGDCIDTPVVPNPDCTEGQTSGNQKCNDCGTQTTKKCVGGSWTDSLGKCSKTVAECTPEPDSCETLAYVNAHRAHCCPKLGEYAAGCWSTRTKYIYVFWDRPVDSLIYHVPIAGAINDDSPTQAEIDPYCSKSYAWGNYPWCSDFICTPENNQKQCMDKACTKRRRTVCSGNNGNNRCTVAVTHPGKLCRKQADGFEYYKLEGW